MAKSRNITHFNYWNNWFIADYEALSNLYAISELDRLTKKYKFRNNFNEDFNVLKTSILNFDTRFEFLSNIFEIINQNNKTFKKKDEFIVNRLKLLLDQLRCEQIPKIPNANTMYHVIIDDSVDEDKSSSEMIKKIEKNLRSELTPKIIELDTSVLKEPIIGKVLSYLSETSITNQYDKELLESILKSIKGNKRGTNKIDNLKEIIAKDISDFSIMVSKRLKGQKVQEITENYDSTLSKIWNNYIKASRKIMYALNLSKNKYEDWIVTISFFKGICKNLENRNTIFSLRDSETNKVKYYLFYGLGA